MGKIVVIHPDLGIGGAERLIVDASKALQEKHHQVLIYTGYHDPNHCFEETKDGTLNIYTIGGWLPRSVLGQFQALIAYTKMIIISLYIIIFVRDYDTILCDQVSACIPPLKLFNYFKRDQFKIVFYCHFPDQLLTSRDSFLKSLYRKPLDQFEEWSTGLADIILVNSNFTGSVVRKTFKSLADRNLEVLYPCVDVSQITRQQLEVKQSSVEDDGSCGSISNDIVKKICRLAEDNYIFMSLNRFERKKNLALAVEAFKECKAAIEAGDDGDQSRGISMKAHLIIVGGYDDRLIDVVQYYEELKHLVFELKLESNVFFVQSPSDKEKILLLQTSHAVLYTPRNEHFGIVPLEAMALSKPVISCNSGGPLETVEDNVSGFLCDDNKISFAQAMLKLYYNRARSVEFGEAGYRRVRKHFSYEAFGDKLNKILYYK